jgi:phospholipid/cholesterol/gamma-HCH transport system substrate-binding protein
MSAPRKLAWGAFGLALVAVIIIIVSSGSSGYTVIAEFKDVDGLRNGSTVKVAGVPAGIVTSLTVTRQGLARAVLTLDPGAAPIGSGASVQVRPTDLLGEHYAQLNVGNLNQPQPSGSFIPDTRTSAPVELDQILNMLNVDVRTRLRILIDEAGIALAGRGADFNTLLGEIPPNLGQAQAMLQQVSSQDATLRTLIAEGGRITTAVNDRRDAMGQLITTAEQALHSVALRQGQLGATMQAAPGALTELHSTLDQLQGASQAIIPAAQSLQLTAPPLTATLRELPGFARVSDPTLLTARSVAPSLERLGRDAQAPVTALRPTAAELNTIARSATPIIGELNNRAMRDALWFIENWALAMKGRDNLGHFVGADLEIDPSIITSALASFTNDGATAAKVHRQPAAAHLTTPAAPTAPPAAPPSNIVTKTLGGLGSVLSPVTAKLGQVLGGVGHTLNGVGHALGGVVGGVLGKVHLGTTGATSTSAPQAGSLGGVGKLLNYLLGR